MRPLLRLPLWRDGLDAALRDMERHVATRAVGYACFCEGNLVATAARDAEVHRILSGATWLFPDGVAATLLARRWGAPVRERVPGPTFLLAACAFGVARGWRHYFYGGSPPVLAALVSRLSDRFPGLCVAGVQSPPFRPLTPDEDAAAVEAIEEAEPDLVWVGLGAPKQERWIASHLGRVSAPVLLGVGAAFDFHGGGQAWAPPWVRRVGLEWAWRMATGGPRVLRRNLTCVIDALLLVLRARAANR